MVNPLLDAHDSHSSEMVILLQHTLHDHKFWSYELVGLEFVSIQALMREPAGVSWLVDDTLLPKNGELIMII